MYVRLVVSGRSPRRADPARSAHRHSPNAAPLVRAAENALARDPDAFPIREGFGLTVVAGCQLPKHRGYEVDDPIIEILVDTGLIADERLQEWLRASSDPSLGDTYVVTLSGTSFREGVAACDAQIRAHLNPGEQVLAVGRGADVTELDGMYGWTFVMVTDRAFRWITHLDLKLEASLTRTSLAFSRRDTAAARALRERLSARGLLPVDPPSPRTPEEPSAPSNGL